MSGISYRDSHGNALDEVWQWDRNITLVVTGAGSLVNPVFHFGNRARPEAAEVTATRSTGGTLSAKIPNALLEDPETLFVWIYADNAAEDEHNTKHAFYITVMPRPKPETV